MLFKRKEKLLNVSVFNKHAPLIALSFTFPKDMLNSVQTEEQFFDFRRAFVDRFKNLQSTVNEGDVMFIFWEAHRWMDYRGFTLAGLKEIISLYF